VAGRVGVAENAASVWVGASSVFVATGEAKLQNTKQHVIPKLLTAVRRVYYTFKKYNHFSSLFL